MLSRVADSIYWLNRYIERAENVARVIDVNLRMMLDLPAGLTEQWEPIVITTGDNDEFKELYGEATKENVLHFLTFDAKNPNSILSCLMAGRTNARSIREIISSELWEQINTFYLMVKEADSRALDSPHDFFQQIRLASHLVSGITEDTMSHGEEYHFGQLGRMLERADKTSRILDVKYFLLLPDIDDVGSPVDDIQWAAVLRSASALEMYRKRWGRVSPGNIVEFLLLDRLFPRAVHRCMITADESLHSITGSITGTFGNVAEQRLGQLRSELNYAQLSGILAQGLHEYVDGFQARLNAAGEAINATFFSAGTVAPL